MTSISHKFGGAKTTGEQMHLQDQGCMAGPSRLLSYPSTSPAPETGVHICEMSGIAQEVAPVRKGKVKQCPSFSLQAQGDTVCAYRCHYAHGCHTEANMLPLPRILVLPFVSSFLQRSISGTSTSVAPRLSLLSLFCTCLSHLPCAKPQVSYSCAQTAVECGRQVAPSVHVGKSNRPAWWL